MNLGKPFSYFLFCFLIPLCAITWFSGASLQKINNLEDRLKNGAKPGSTDSTNYYRSKTVTSGGEIKLLIDSIFILNQVISNTGKASTIIIHDTIYVPKREVVDRPVIVRIHDTIRKIEYVDRVKTEYVDKVRTEYVDRIVYKHDTIWRPKPLNRNTFGAFQENVRSLINGIRIPDTTKNSLVQSIGNLFRRYYQQ